MIVTTIYLAAGGASADPWPVLGNSGTERLAIAALADLTLARRLQVAPAADDESPAARRLAIVPGPPLPHVLSAAIDALTSVTKQLDVDRAVRSLRNLAPAVEAALVSTGELVEHGTKGLLKKRPAVVAHPQWLAAARQRIGSFAWPPSAEAHALALIATTGLPDQRRWEMLGGTAGPELGALDPFGTFDPNAPAPDGAPIGPNGADLLSALTLELAATSDTTGWASA